MAAQLVAGDRAQLGLAIRGGFRTAAPKHKCQIVVSSTKWYQALSNKGLPRFYGL